jgi:hypothetical protein
VLINSVLMSLVMFKISFLRCQEGFLKKLTSMDLASTDKVMTIRKNTGW